MRRAGTQAEWYTAVGSRMSRQGGSAHRPGAVEARVRELIFQVLPPSTQPIGDADLLTEHGMDSVTATQLSCMLAESFDLLLSPAIALEYPTLQSLSNRIVQLVTAEGRRQAG